MPRRRLTKQQSRRVRSRQETLWESREDTELLAGQVRTRFGRHAEVLLDDERVIHCHLRSNLNDVVCGDEVLIQVLEDGAGIIASRNPRNTELARPGPRGEPRVIAANLDLLIIVCAPKPLADLRLIDQYISSAEHAHLHPLLVLNKSDLAGAETAELLEQLKTYRNLGYPVIESSATSGRGLTELLRQIGQSTCVLVGQSGVGKSSLVRALVPGEDVEVGALSEGSGLGTHTTTTTRSYPLAGGGLLIDSPGIREFPLLTMSTAELAESFREFRPFLQRCRFRDCHHREDPGCALQAAADDGQIESRRLESFLLFDEGMEPLRAP